MSQRLGLVELDELDRVFNALAHPARRHVLQVLNARGGAMNAGGLAARFSHSWPTTTRHLRVLEQAGLVTVDSDGRHRSYRLDRKRLLTVTDIWLDPIRYPSRPAHDSRPDPRTSNGESVPPYAT